MSENRICVGAIAGSFGVKGEVRLKSFCADPEAIADYAPLYSEDGSRSFSPVITQKISNGFAARIPGIATREEAEALRGISLFADRDKLPALPDEEFYHADLIGLEVADTGGAVLGKVAAVLNHGAGDLLEVIRPDGAGTVLVPFTQAIVPTVDLNAGRIVIDPPEGLL